MTCTAVINAATGLECGAMPVVRITSRDAPWTRCYCARHWPEHEAAAHDFGMVIERLDAPASVEAAE